MTQEMVGDGGYQQMPVMPGLMIGMAEGMNKKVVAGIVLAEMERRDPAFYKALTETVLQRGMDTAAKTVHFEIWHDLRQDDPAVTKSAALDVDTPLWAVLATMYKALNLVPLMAIREYAGLDDDPRYLDPAPAASDAQAGALPLPPGTPDH